MGDTQATNVGRRILSAYPRIPQSAGGVRVEAAGLNVEVFNLSVVGVPPGPNNTLEWPIVANRMYRFSGSAIVIPAVPGALALESASMVAQVYHHATGLGGANFEVANAGRFGAVTALATNQGISFDPWEIDCNDLRNMPGVVPKILGLGGQNSDPPWDVFLLGVRIVLNETGAGQQAIFNVVVTTDAADFNGIAIPRWDSQ